MAKVFNRAWMTTATAGTGTMTLGSAVAKHGTFAEAGVANADVVSYTIIDGDNFEIGIGTYTAAGTTLSRDTVTFSKIAGVAGTTKLTLSGTATVFISARKEDLVRSPGTVTDSRPALFDGTSGELLKQHTAALGTAAAKNTGASGDAVPLLNIANTWSADQTFTGTVAGAGPITAQTTEDSASSGPLFVLDRVSASPAASDVLGAFVFFGRDSGGNSTQVGNVQARWIDPTDTSEDSEFGLATQIAGTFDFRMFVGNGVIIGAPTGSYKGNGTLNAVAVYDDNTLLTDVVQDWAERGTVDLDKWDNLVPDREHPEVRERIAVMEQDPVATIFTRIDPKDGTIIAETKMAKHQAKEWVPIFDKDGNGLAAVEVPVFEERVIPARTEKRYHSGARIFKQLIDDGFNPKDPESFINYVATNKALPGLPTEAEWQHSKFSIGELHTRSTLAMEILTQTIIGLTERVIALEKNGKTL